MSYIENVNSGRPKAVEYGIDSYRCKKGEPKDGGAHCIEWVESKGRVKELVEIYTAKIELERWLREQAHKPLKRQNGPKRAPVINTCISETTFNPRLNVRIASNIIPVSPDNPFYKTDLQVFKNSYAGVLPLNGITEKNFIKISTHIFELQKNKKSGSLVIAAPSHGSPTIVKRQTKAESVISEMIVQLCRREIGRELILSLIYQDKELRIIPSDDLDPSSITYKHFFSKEIKSIEIYINPDLIIEPEVVKNGKSYLDVAPLFIVLGHEMLHALHHFSAQEATTQRRDTRHPESQNMEEYLTITGWNEAIMIPVRSEVEDDTALFLDTCEEDWDLMVEDKKVETEDFFLWDPKCENGLRSVYGLPPRTNSYANKKITTKSVKINLTIEPFFNEIKCHRHLDLRFFFTKEFKDVICTKYEWKKFLNKAAKEACKYKRWETVSRLVEEGADPCLIRQDWKSSLDAEVVFAAVEENLQLIESLIEFGAAPLSDELQDNSFLSLKLKTLFFDELKSYYFSGDFKSRFTGNFKKTIGFGADWLKFLNDAAEVAVQNKNWEIVEQLVQEGANIEFIKNKWKGILDSEIVACCHNNEWNNVLALVKLDANPHQKIGTADNLIAFACEHNHPMIRSLLGYLIKQCNFDPNQCFYSVLNSQEAPSIELITYLIKDCGVDPNAFIKKMSPIWIALNRRHFDLIKPLIELGANPHTLSAGFQHFSILHALATKQDVPDDLFDFLVKECRMDPLAESERGITAFSLAEASNREKLLELAEFYEKIWVADSI